MKIVNVKKKENDKTIVEKLTIGRILIKFYVTLKGLSGIKRGKLETSSYGSEVYCQMEAKVGSGQIGHV